MIPTDINPEVLAQLLRMGSLGDRSKLLEAKAGDENEVIAHQFARAQALRRGDRTQYTNPWAVGIQGLGNLVGNAAGARQENQLLGQRADQLKTLRQGQENILGQQDAGRAAYVAQLLQALRQRGPSPEANGQPAPPPGSDVPSSPLETLPVNQRRPRFASVDPFGGW